MPLWLIRCGRYGEHEQKFLDENRVYLTWRNLPDDLAPLAGRDAIRGQLAEVSLKAEAPLKRVWTVAGGDESEED